jgi:RNase P/RNase MRP subunit p29
MAQTFAPGYVRPGTYVEVKFAPTPNVIVPPFVTALIGRTSESKPATITLIRNAANDVRVVFDSNGLAASGADSDEAIRRDFVDTYNNVAKSGGVLVMNSAVDSLGTGHLKGSSQAWVPFNSGVASSDKVYVEWVAKYYTVPATGSVFAGSMSSGQLVSIAGVTQESQTVGGISFVDQTTEISASDGDHTMTLTNTAGIYTIAWDGGTASTGFNALTPIFEAVLDGSPSLGQIKVLVDPAKVTAVGVGAGETFTSTVRVSTAGPAYGTSTTPGTYSVGNHGVSYTLAYGKPKTSSDFAVQRFDDVTALQNFHGAIDINTGTDYLSLGALPYFTAGGGPAFAVPLRDKAITGISTDPDLTNDAGYVEAVRLALQLLENNVEVACVIVLSPTEVAGNGNFRPDILNYVKTHCLEMSSTSKRKPRMGILGAVANETNESVFIAAAQAAGTNRIVYLAPATATLNAGGRTFTVDGSTMAAGLAGILSRPDINAGEPISGKSFDMFSDVSDQFTETQKNRMAATGITIIEKQGGATKVRHFLTTDPTNVLLSEAKVTRIEIDYRKSLVQALDAVMINTRFTPTAIGTVKSIIGQISDSKRVAEIINDYRIIKVAVNPVEPRQLDVEVAVQPTLDLNWIFISATFQTSVS